jgi:EAL domain-containing protein (putative c-di-GMP-specific phosphodiesterase class I)
VENGELVLHFQPKIDCRGGHLAGLEALARWRHPRFGLLGPDRFIGLAEETHYIRQLTRWAISAALEQCRAWLDEGLDVPVAVNVSALDLQDERLPGLIANLLDRHRLASNKLIVEITETALLVDANCALLTLNQLATLGVGVSLDDFGTGYSSLSYLKQFPVDQLKIDRSLVTDLTTQPRDRAIVESTIELGHRLGLTVVAEGIEDAMTFELLGKLGCDQAQGYYIGRPMAGRELQRWLAGWLRDVGMAA